jgi:signal transduction histidine kinase
MMISMRLVELLEQCHDEIVERWIDRAAGRLAPRALPRPQLADHMPGFLRELAAALRTAEGGPPGRLPERSPKSQQHGEQRLMLGIDIASVVGEFGVMAEVIWDLARERGVDISVDEIALLMRSINTGMRDSAEQYTNRRDKEQRELAAHHFAFLAHELRNPLQSARMALQLLEERGVVPLGNARNVLDRGLLHIQELIDRALISMRLAAGAETGPREEIELGPMLRELAADSAIDRERRRQSLSLQVAEGVVLSCEPRLLRSAVGNLLRNAIKFSREESTVTVRVHRFEGRLVIEVEDECGGIAPERVSELFDPFVQAGSDRSGFGLGLAIAKQAAEAHRGSLRVVNLPGKGCVFALDLPVVQV